MSTTLARRPPFFAAKLHICVFPGHKKTRASPAACFAYTSQKNPRHCAVHVCVSGSHYEQAHKVWLVSSSRFFWRRRRLRLQLRFQGAQPRPEERGLEAVREVERDPGQVRAVAEEAGGHAAGERTGNKTSPRSQKFLPSSNPLSKLSLLLPRKR